MIEIRGGSPTRSRPAGRLTSGWTWATMVAVEMAPLDQTEQGYASVLGRLVFSVDGEEFRWEDALLAARLSGEWAELESRTAEGVACARRVEVEGDPLGQDEVSSAAKAFRYARDLLSGDEMEAWLERWELDVIDGWRSSAAPYGGSTGRPTSQRLRPAFRRRRTRSGKRSGWTRSAPARWRSSRGRSRPVRPPTVRWAARRRATAKARADRSARRVVPPLLRAERDPGGARAPRRRARDGLVARGGPFADPARRGDGARGGPLRARRWYAANGGRRTGRSGSEQRTRVPGGRRASAQGHARQRGRGRAARPGSGRRGIPGDGRHGEDAPIGRETRDSRARRARGGEARRRAGGDHPGAVARAAVEFADERL